MGNTLGQEEQRGNVEQIKRTMRIKLMLIRRLLNTMQISLSELHVTSDTIYLYTPIMDDCFYDP